MRTGAPEVRHEELFAVGRGYVCATAHIGKAELEIDKTGADALFQRANAVGVISFWKKQFDSDPARPVLLFEGLIA